MTQEGTLYSFVATFVASLARAGVRHACICPGSRSTPLALVLADDPGIRIWTHLDERSASFFALGMAKQLGQPVAVLCTSGTAAANFLPAVIEAHMAHVPLIVLTADRPPELQDIGSPQTIDQHRLYGSHVKWSAEAPLPDNRPDILRYAGMLAIRAFTVAMEEAPGPVHINFPFREPLIPVRETAGGRPASEDTVRFPGVHLAARNLSGKSTHDLAHRIHSIKHGLIVCGPQDNPNFPAAVTELARLTGYPILADPLSGVRCGPHDRSRVVDAYDVLLRFPQSMGLEPEIVLRFGAAPTSKALTGFLRSSMEAQHIVVTTSDWSDPTVQATDMIHSDPARLCEDLISVFATSTEACGEQSWLVEWLRLNKLARQTIERRFQSMPEVFDGKVFAELAHLVPDNSTLYVGNSMPVRDLDTFFPSGAQHIRFLGNRGANGIDGVVSSALGAAAAQAAPVMLVIGDLSFYHDLNGLLAARLHELNLTIVLLNNDGGGIFSFLPQKEGAGHFEQLFGTPHGLDFAPVIGMYGGTCERVRTWEHFRVVVQQGINTPGLSVIEVPTERARNVELHRAIWDDVARELALRVPVPTR